MPPQDGSDPLTIETLVEHYDEASRDTYLSFYADLTSALWERALEARHDEVSETLGAETAEQVGLDPAYEQAVEAIHRMQRSGAKGAAVFLSPTHGLESVHALGGPTPTRLIVDSSPYVAPLAQYQDAYAPFLLVLVDGERGAIWRVEAGETELEGTQKMDLIGRHKKGGFSQMRYQRHRAGRMDRLFDELIERIEEAVRDEEIERIIVAGPGQAKDRLVDRFPQHLEERLGAVEDLDLDDPRDDPDVTRFVRLAKRLSADENQELVSALKDEVLSDGLAATEPFAVARAARDGRVDTLLVLEGCAAGGRKCEEHQAFFAEGDTCACGNEGTQVDLLNEAVEHTLGTDGTVAFVEGDEPFLEKRGGIGAFLRW